MSHAEHVLVRVRCIHPPGDVSCTSCFGTRWRYVPRWWTPEEFDAMTSPLRRFIERAAP